ncbi:MAG: hypothetical protein MK074_01040 [Phycisphaerales bacterium]|nr:hypothetical protein [Phycisphaerales bacterium]
MMNQIQHMRRKSTATSLMATALGGAFLLGGCSDPEPPPPPPKPKPVADTRPKAKSPEELKQQLGIDARIHMDELTAPNEESIRAAGLLLANAMLKLDGSLAAQLSGTDEAMAAMLANPGFIEAVSQVDRIDLEFGRVLGDDAMLVIWEFSEHLEAQMWSVAGPVSAGEAPSFWPGYVSDVLPNSSVDVTAESAWSWTDGAQVAFIATPGMPDMISQLGEEPFQDWTAMVEAWEETAKMVDQDVAIIDAYADEAGDEDERPSGSGFGRPSGGSIGGGVRPR